MDAPGDRDIELQRASGDLIHEFKAKLPPLLWKSAGDKRQVHRWAQRVRTEKLRTLLEPFQEWPQLLDPHLQGILSQLTDAFLTYLELYQDQYASTAAVTIPKNGAVEPLPRAICKLIYVLCKVRGVKVITRFLNNEPRYLEHILRAFIDWDSVVADNDAAASSMGQGLPLTWEERYVILQWLSHLFLAPFDLASISSDTIPIPYDNLSVLSGLSAYLPPVTRSALSISLKYALLPGKERETAVALLARLALRSDMQKLGVLEALINWAYSTLDSNSSGSTNPEYATIGILSFIARLGVQGRADDLGPYVESISDRTMALTIEKSPVCKAIRASAFARKILIKIIRSMAILTLALEERLSREFSDKSSTILENAIDHFLLSLADKDTPVRLAASKALSMVTLKLGPEMGSDIVEAVLEALEDNILYEKRDGTLISRFQAEKTDPSLIKRNTSAVNTQIWHGQILTLGHLLFRRALPSSKLGQVLQSLFCGLDFEQRSSTGSSVGSGVRDASCFGIWSVARKYSTKELQVLDPREVKVRTSQDDNVLQVLAIELVCAACLDPSGNIRRGASAALQELIGRHPDMVFEGISLVQIVDYHAVARRAKAMQEVARDAAALGSIYWLPLFGALLDWRGIGSPDSRSRRAAASAIGELSSQGSYNTILAVLCQTRQRLSDMSPYAIEPRHGCLLSLAAVIETFLSFKLTEPDPDGTARQIASEVSKVWEILDSKTGPTKESLTLSELRPDLIAEASARFLSALARSYAPAAGQSGPSRRLPEKFLNKAIDILGLCVCRSDDIPMKASSEAASDLFVLLSSEKQLDVLKRWLDNIDASWKSATGQGQIAALGAVFKHVPTAGQGRKLILRGLLKSTAVEELIAKRKSAAQCIATQILPFSDEIELLSSHLQVFLNDYTTDRRGDIGSLIRLEAIGGVKLNLQSKFRRSPYTHDLMKCVIRLAAEKLDKVRFEAWKCFEAFWGSEPALPPLQMMYEHLSEVCTVEYFLQLFILLSVDWLRPSLLKGLVTSFSAGTEGLVRASRLALVQFIQEQAGDDSNRLKLNIFNDMMWVLESTMDDDRYAIPAVDTICFLLGNCFEDLAGLDLNFRKLFLLVQKSHFKSSNIPRIEVAVKTYATLLRQECIQKDVMKKMMSLLLHSYPKIRSITAECLFMEINNEIFKKTDWLLSPHQLKTTVDKLRQEYRLT
ncbi:hypothetical protein CIHG_05708 [Coccidioides immitis H538.4]|uniref:Uncharacterized protein n=1 Tax=Coccidioides immitis H538.4 TaxID=396776 RepID=A0A0J8RTN1_COCIT|nr:hypothetical protein CIHG_05708 [Coccidioides immitis H538.4]